MMSRIEAFAAQGVTLKYPQSSWSGIRGDDGCVVIAIRDTDIQVSLDGFSCLLWAPRSGAGERPIRQERLEHCRLAALRGGAEGLLVCGKAAQVEPGVLLTLRVEKRRGEFWALWGSASRAASLRSGHGWQVPLALQLGRLAA